MLLLLRKQLANLQEKFWVLPGIMVIVSVLGAFALVFIDQSGLISRAALEGPWLYNGGGTGARTLLGAVASSTIGVAGTVFSITIAALSLAAGQMGPRLLRNFVRDRGNQFTLGTFLGTFAYSLIVLRSVRTQSEGAFTPHLSLTIAIVLALVCVATLVFFVGHMAGRINVDVVIDLVSQDIRAALQVIRTQGPQTPPPPAASWSDPTAVRDARHGYLQHLDTDALADWAIRHHVKIKLLVGPGDFVFPGAPAALTSAAVEDAAEALGSAASLGSQRTGSKDLKFAVSNLVEVAVRALSPGINDPHTAISVLDRLGSALCEIAPLELPTGVISRDGVPVVVFPSISYDSLVNSMFHSIRQYAQSSPSVLIRLLDVITIVLTCERNLSRIQTLSRHADLVMEDSERAINNPSDLEDIRRRWLWFRQVRTKGDQALMEAE